MRGRDDAEDTLRRRRDIVRRHLQPHEPSELRLPLDGDDLRRGVVHGCWCARAVQV